MKIAFVCGNYLPFVGGVEIHADQVARSLSMRHDVTLAAVNLAKRRVPRRLEMLSTNLLSVRTSDRWDGRVQVVSLAPAWWQRIVMAPLLIRATPRLQRWFYHELNRMSRPFYVQALRGRLRRLIAGRDVVHCLSSGDLGIAVESVARSLGVPVVCTPFVHPRQWADGPDDIALYNRCQTVIGLVSSDRDYLEQIGVRSELLRVVGVSPSLPERIDASAFRERERIEGEPVILYIGRMMKQKGADAILRAAPLVWKRFSDARFYFAGPGSPDELRIFEESDPRIRYLGRVSDREKAEAVAGCNVFCMPSTSEILPTVYLEAWSLGKPVVGGTAHGLRELVEGNGAGMVAEQTPEGVAAVLLKFLDDPNLCEACGEAGRKLVAERYSIAAVTRQLETVYEEVVSAGKVSQEPRGKWHH